MARRALPATTYSEVIERTPAQQQTVTKLEAEGWVVVTEPEGTFNSAMMLEGPTKHCFVWPDGSVTDTYR